MTEKLTEKDYEVLDACCELLSMKIDELKAENDRLNKILQEIKEYAESIGNEEMINGYAIRAKSALWRIANKITKVEEE